MQSVCGEIEQVRNMKYLGAILSADGTCEEEIEQRVGAAVRVIGAMRKEVLERKELKKATKMRVYNAIVLPTMLYGSETWTVMKRHESRLGATEMAYLRRVEGVTRMDRVKCRCKRGSWTRGGDGESKKETKSMEGEAGADGRQQISEEGVN